MENFICLIGTFKVTVLAQTKLMDLNNHAPNNPMVLQYIGTVMRHISRKWVLNAGPLDLQLSLLPVDRTCIFNHFYRKWVTILY